MICGCYGQPLSWAELLFGRLKNEIKPGSERADANEDGDFTDRYGGVRNIWIFSNTREIKSKLN